VTGQPSNHVLRGVALAGLPRRLPVVRDEGRHRQADRQRRAIGPGGGDRETRPQLPDLTEGRSEPDESERLRERAVVADAFLEAGTHGGAPHDDLGDVEIKEHLLGNRARRALADTSGWHGMVASPLPGRARRGGGMTCRSGRAPTRCAGGCRFGTWCCAPVRTPSRDRRPPAAIHRGRDPAAAPGHFRLLNVVPCVRAPIEHSGHGPTARRGVRTRWCVPRGRGVPSQPATGERRQALRVRATADPRT
jgi:hypothetical protein